DKGHFRAIPHVLLAQCPKMPTGRVRKREPSAIRGNCCTHEWWQRSAWGTQASKSNRAQHLKNIEIAGRALKCDSRAITADQYRGTLRVPQTSAGNRIQAIVSITPGSHHKFFVWIEHQRADAA